MPRDIAVDIPTGDIQFVNGDIQMATGAEYYRQKLAIRLAFFFKEWTFDTTLGIDYFKIFFIKNPDLTLCDNLIKITITETEGIQELTEFRSSFDKFQRIYTYSFKCVTIDGDIIIFNDEVISN